MTKSQVKLIAAAPLGALRGLETFLQLVQVGAEGIGIPADEIESLFQPFHGSFAKGSGLGLAIVHRTVTDYKGEIEIISRKGSGTTVSVRLPARTTVNS